MKQVFTIYKNRGETPLEALERFRADNREYVDIPLTYAGRLDPAAHGVLLVLAGEECKKKKEYLGLLKEYAAEILFGITTDTYDLLGVIENISPPKEFDPEILVDLPQKFIGEHMWQYPAFSSKTVDGKPLWQWAREGKLDEIEVPMRKMVFNEIEMGDVSVVDSMELLKGVEELLHLIKGDFRQEEILASWKELPQRAFPLLRLRVKCESGSYIRSLAHAIGQEYEIGACLLDLERTRVGEWNLETNE